MTEMTFTNESFDFIIDKGSLDALMSTDSEETLHQAASMFRHISRLLRDKGSYICVSLGEDYILRTLLHSYTLNSLWNISISRITELLHNPLVPFVFTLTKGGEVEDGLCSLYFDSIGNTLSTPMTVPAIDVIPMVSKTNIIISLTYHY
jgi:hypothetical protein